MTEHSMKQLLLYAPVSGRTVAIETVPDPVFAEKMVGDGISVDPASFVLCAPCDGTVANIHSAHHALTLSTPEGLDVLMHIGLDTVMLKGEGFDVRVKTGQAVKKGDELIAFDAALIRSRGKSLLTELIITNGERVMKMEAALDREVTAGKDVVLTLTLAAARPSPATDAVVELPPAHTAESWTMIIINPAGLHARPTAVLVNAAKKYVSDITLVRGGESANAKSIVSLMGLDVKKGDEVRLIAKGPDAVEALRELIPLIQSGLGEDPSQAPEPEEKKPVPAVEKSDRPDRLNGIPASPGVAVGEVVQLREMEISVEETGGTAEEENEKLQVALARAKQQLSELHEQMLKQADAGKAAIFLAHQEILEDPELVENARNIIGKGRSAAFAWQQAIKGQATMLAGLKNELLAARANDLRDVGRRVLRLLVGETETKQVLPDNAILIAEDLTPSDTAGLDRTRVVGFCTTRGGATSHVAILARTLSLPAIAGIEMRALDLPNGTTVMLDGTKGVLRLNPDEAERRAIREEQEKEKKTREEQLAAAKQPAVTTDDNRIEVAGNIGDPADAEQVVELGGDGVGLLRSEFLFLQRTEAPGEDEQAAVYTSIAETLGRDRSLIVRTLDVGGDKPLAYLPMPHEDNPFLGVRGIRLCLRQPNIFRTQIRAILRAADKTQMRIMFPMVTTLEEIKEARKIVEEERATLKAPPVEVGIMIEVPAAALMADVLAPHIDFFSIGTNDLTQYVLAMDRGNADLARTADGLHPAVLRMIAATVSGAEKYGKWVGVCGGLAGEEEAVPVLIGLGVDELSVAAPAIPPVKSLIRKLSISRCRRLARDVLQLSTAKEVHEKIAEFQKELG
ncbi:MAG: phosphoenolpyruvate--protein phosphotransferase [Alphaproteobacteria bacterium]